jgi:lipopolysaccharide export system protein LptA
MKKSFWERIKTYGLFLAVILLASVIFMVLRKPDLVKEQVADRVIKRPDFVFKGVTVSEISGPKKYWELTAQTADIEKQNAVMRKAVGIFYRQQRPALKIVSPYMVLNMDSRNISAASPLATSLGTSAEQSVSMNAKMLHWRADAEELTGEGDVRIRRRDYLLSGDHLKSSLALEKVTLWGRASAQTDVQIEAKQFEMDNPADLLTAKEQVIINKDKLRIFCDELKYYKAKKEIYVYGRVKVVHEKMTMLCRSAKYLPEDGLVYASDDIKFVLDDIRGTSQKATFYQKEEKAVLEGSPQAWQGASKLKGDRITIYLQDKKIVTEGSTKIQMKCSC